MPALISDLIELYCDGNQLTCLPPLPSSLINLLCAHNQLTCLPPLPPNLKELYCDHNRLISLPELPQKLKSLSCENNHITSLPLLSKYLLWLDYNNNPIYDVINSEDIITIRDRVQIINNFRFLYYCVKYKKRFRHWLWTKIREPKIMKHYSPANLVKLLDGVDSQAEFDQRLSTW